MESFPSNSAHARRHVAPEVGWAAASELAADELPDLGGAGVDPLGAHAAAQEDLAGDVAVRAAGGGDVRRGRVGQAVHLAQRGVHAGGVLRRGLQQQRAVDVEEEQPHREPQVTSSVVMAGGVRSVWSTVQ